MKARLTVDLDSVAAGVVLLVAWKAVSGRPQRPTPINGKVPREYMEKMSGLRPGHKGEPKGEDA